MVIELDLRSYKESVSLSDTSHQTNAGVGADKTHSPESSPTAHTTVHKLVHLAITKVKPNQAFHLPGSEVRQANI